MENGATKNENLSFLKKIDRTFDNNEGGYSWRKIAGLIGIITACILSFRYTTENNIIQMNASWLTFVAVCIGLITIPDLLKALKTVKGVKENDESSK